MTEPISKTDDGRSWFGAAIIVGAGVFVLGTHYWLFWYEKNQLAALCLVGGWALGVIVCTLPRIFEKP